MFLSQVILSIGVGGVIEVVSIFLLTMVKFIAGPTLGYAAGYSLLNTIILTTLGTMTSVTLFTYLGRFMRERVFYYFFKKRKLFSKRNRRLVIIWRKYGVVGVAFLTPLILTPIGGTVMLTSMNTPHKKIIVYMLVSATGWAVVMSSAIYILGDKLLVWLPSL